MIWVVILPKINLSLEIPFNTKRCKWKDKDTNNNNWKYIHLFIVILTRILQIYLLFIYLIHLWVVWWEGRVAAKGCRGNYLWKNKIKTQIGTKIKLKIAGTKFKLNRDRSVDECWSGADEQHQLRLEERTPAKQPIGLLHCIHLQSHVMKDGTPR